MVTGAAPLTCWVCRAGVTETTCSGTAAAWVAWPLLPWRPAAAEPLARSWFIANQEPPAAVARIATASTVTRTGRRPS